MIKKHLPNLALCVFLDLIGCASYLIPVIGEFSDIIWAPLSGIIFFSLFGKKLGVFGSMFSVVEELLPGMDIIPTFTIAWFMRKKEIEKEAAEKRLKIFR